VIDGSPMVSGHVLGPSLLDAMIIARPKSPPTDILEDDIFSDHHQPRTRAAHHLSERLQAGQPFAFVIHPLSQEYFKNIKSIDLLSRVSPPAFMDTVEKAMAYAPPFVYSKVTGIKSPTGVEAEGWLIFRGRDAKEIMSHSPEFTYRRLLDAARMAKRLGAQDHGPRRIHQVVGDAGLYRSPARPLPITTAQQLRASGALWAAHNS